MSPYPAQVNRDEIIDRAREIIETEGLDRLTLQHLATALGIQAPSLYRHVGSKNELLRAVNEITIASLIETVLSAANTEAPTGERVKRMATAYRTFAQQYPVTYHLAFSALSPELRPDPQALESLVRQVEMLLAELTGEAASATALRGLLSFVHGFVMLEQAGQFQRGADLLADFDQSVNVFVLGWTAATEA